ncbi:TetR/AcrR family transcriptional regulator [Xenorhabdus sp. 12]|uniref:TetR/AcrR family transcriptional regulator n=1 Tax=Xenorhabdus santafensis TaxID=2582833 RepID=A0ABU4S6C0_9GAMM|nr:TetR/AcrR family transcriptional regulator [Xenorhabdus sp. 12]MDX7986743.1 TetR/AcrR family transcriptional regulator [Xenorhabdus sp. 12]
MAKMGRPRTFNRDEAIQQAMNLFWEHGYESTSLSLLKAGIGGGITAPSFYAAFGSKEALFREVVERYIATHGQVVASLWDESLSPRQAIELSLRRSAKMQTESGHPKGCLLVLSTSACSPEHEHVQKLLAKQRERTNEGFRQCVQRAVNSGELPADIDIQAFAAVFYCFLGGLSILARDGVSGAVLDAAVTEIMRNWDVRAASMAG